MKRKRNNSMPVEKRCSKGHVFYKSSNCPVCPVCEKENKATSGFLSLLGAPARRALKNAGITTLQKLSSFSEKEIVQLHGIGKTSLPVLEKALAEKGLHLKR
ncbi:MAG TPA: DNA-directed RNA polymerase subunit alpha C-terminal domain-containing protein [Ferruginibacter sp.]|nr:DNA-directed RNA polymerase subunit alpha C-terminal domain-containing protein [Ferruginibacter sp.]HPH90659.1 DNA-directed RNA polymerase subunit alpha C-terminal domain-containing protein [Ferruginibacter sp.]